MPGAPEGKSDRVTPVGVGIPAVQRNDECDRQDLRVPHSVLRNVRPMQMPVKLTARRLGVFLTDRALGRERANWRRIVGSGLLERSPNADEVNDASLQRHPLRQM